MLDSKFKVHKLKTDHEPFYELASGNKTHEIRFNDRDFQVGDILELHCTVFSGAEMKAGKPLQFTGEVEYRSISHIQKGYGLEEGWVILSFQLWRKPLKKVGEIKLYAPAGVICAPFDRPEWTEGMMPERGTKLYAKL